MNRYIQYMYSYPHKTAYRAMQNVNLKNYMTNLEGEGHSLYLHLPFCESKCGYCNLFSVAGCGKSQMDAYLDVLPRQIGQYREILPESTVFGDFTIGGGTPLLLDPGQLVRMFRMVRNGMPLGAECQIVIETAPKQTDREKARLLKELGVTRVSMGIQSFADEELAWLGRYHDSCRAQEAADCLKEAAFDCVNFDFIYGLPGQTGESLVDSLGRAVSFSPDEIFLYPLYIKHGVRLERDGKDAMLDSDHTYTLYGRGAAYLKEHGYEQMSMRRFVKKKGSDSIKAEFRECGFTGALALGCGGRSYLGRLHTCTPYRTTRQDVLQEMEAYLEREDFCPVSHGILLSDEEVRRRYVIKHLLIHPGISKGAYADSFGTVVTEDFPILRTWTECGWVIEDSTFLSLSEEGMGLSDYIGPQLISENIREKMLEWERVNGQENHLLQGKPEKL
ncbi:STM4012 family radical SAM protein [Acetatifactor muris]|uniref:STM4012 family radical SAM protein n=1 Tax=Acetatifactor muris TaxID=879566 RepID=UPI0023F59328|nr:STM4012 family radical SAM protein [Acetatifactor muris]